MDSMDVSALIEVLTQMGNPSMHQCPFHINKIMMQVAEQINELIYVGIEDTLTPTLEEVVALGPGNYQRHPAISKLFKWLVDPQRTVHEFNYVVGPLGQYTFEYYGRFKNLYLGLVAAEALAVRNPILDGPWKHTAWFVVWLNSEFCKEYNYGTASDNLSDWIIRMMGDPDICPNPYLRLEFMSMFGSMVCVNAKNGKQAFEAVISTCSFFNDEYIESINTNISKVTLYSTIRMLEKFVAGGYLLAFDENLAHILKSQISNIICDVSCSYSLKPYRNTGRQDMKMIIGLFYFTAGFAEQELERFRELSFYPAQETVIEDIAYALLVLITHFKKSCQTPQLVDLTAACVMDVLELVLLVNIARMNQKGEVYSKTLHTTHKLLGELCDKNTGFNIALTPVGQIMSLRAHKRLSNLRRELGKYQPESHMISSMLYHCNFI